MLYVLLDYHHAKPVLYLQVMPSAKQIMLLQICCVQLQLYCVDSVFRCKVLFGVLDPRCLTGSALLDCHALKGFGIYMIGILDNLSGVWKSITGTHRVTSTCNLSSII